MSAPENTTYMTLLEELTPDLERADAAETPQDLLEAIQDAQDRTERFPVAHPERVEKWYIEGYRRDLHDWLRRDFLELRAACCLLYGRRPDRPSVSKGGLRLSASEALNSSDWDNNEPGIDTRFSFYELALQAVELTGNFDCR